jgi:hypothetical protein
MGLLDDAIREHLELKRRHGADPDEVSRQEREALGAPVRGEFAKPAGEGDEPAAVAAGHEGPVADVPEVAEPPEMPGEPEPESAAQPAAARPEPEPEPAEEATAARPEPEPEPAEEATAARPEPEPGDEEDPWLVEDLADPEPAREAEPEAAAPAPEPEPGQGEDVLEETPEFLQETPEHDRLWFEQKPPRDFDWDK